MILIQRGKEPDSLLQYRKSSSDACYEELPQKPREDIRNQMWEEQKGLCAYCMRKIDSPQNLRIEHFKERHPLKQPYDAAETLNFKNMLGVCYGNSLKPNVKYEHITCDAHRKNLKLTVNPYDIHSIRKIKYSADGYVTSDDTEIRKDVEETLNLNCHSVSLPENRKSVLCQFKKELLRLCGNKSHDTYLQILNKIYKQYTVQRALTPYCGIIISWLEKELGIR